MRKCLAKNKKFIIIFIKLVNRERTTRMGMLVGLNTGMNTAQVNRTNLNKNKVNFGSASLQKDVFQKSASAVSFGGSCFDAGTLKFVYEELLQNPLEVASLSKLPAQPPFEKYNKIFVDGVEQISFVSDSGSKAEIKGLYIAPQAGKDTFVLFHDSIANAKAMQDVMQQLKDQGLGVLCIDPEGFGDSGGKASEPTIRKNASQAVDWLNNTKDTPNSKMVLWGQGLGALMAVHAAVNAKEPVKGLTLDAPFANAARLDSYLISTGKVFNDTPRVKELKAMDPDVRMKAIAQDILKAGAPGILDINNLKEGYLKKIPEATKVLITCASDDISVSPELSADVAGKIPTAKFIKGEGDKYNKPDVKDQLIHVKLEPRMADAIDYFN